MSSDCFRLAGERIQVTQDSQSWLVTIITATLYGTTLLVVSTILPQMQGTLSATP